VEKIKKTNAGPKHGTRGVESKIYTAKLCSSMPRNIETSSLIKIKPHIPNTVNNTIKRYLANTGNPLPLPVRVEVEPNRSTNAPTK
jgi:hypothetical protein